MIRFGLLAVGLAVLPGGASHRGGSSKALAKDQRLRTPARRHPSVAGYGHFPSLPISRTLALRARRPSSDSIGCSS